MPKPPKDPTDPGNVIRWPLDELGIDNLSLKDFTAFAELAESQGLSIEALLGEAVRLMLARHRKDKGPAQIIPLPKPPKGPTLG